VGTIADRDTYDSNNVVTLGEYLLLSPKLQHHQRAKAISAPAKKIRPTFLWWLTCGRICGSVIKMKRCYIENGGAKNCGRWCPP